MSNSGARWLGFFLVVVISGSLIYFAGRRALAEHWARSPDPAQWVQAAAIEPGNAEFWYRLGRFRQLDFAQGNLQLAIEDYRRALAIDPRSADYWTELGGAYEAAGEVEQARQAFEHARAVYPISAGVAWRYGNFLLRREKFDEAFAQIRRAVLGDSKLAPLAISRCWRSTRDIQGILNKALPPDSGAYLEALDFLVREGEVNASLVVWQRLVALQPTFAQAGAFPLIDLLLQNRRWEEAGPVWHQSLEIAGVREPASVGVSLVWDGGFEGDFTNGGFGWRQTDVPGAAVDFDPETRHSGARSLRITLDGSENLYYENVYQVVLVQPDTPYRLRAYLRTQDISTDRGIQFWIGDASNGGFRGFATPERVGTQDWTLEQGDFTTGPETHLIGIALRRFRSEKFDNKIRGTVWVDDVSLVPLTPPKARTVP